MMKMMMRILRLLPLWAHVLAARIVRPRFIVGVAALVFNADGQVLLFKHTYRRFPWGLPGGGLEYNEQPSDAIVREFFEEAGITIDVRRLLLGQSSPHFHHVGLVYLCEVVGGEFRESNEISEMRYFDVNDLPPMIFDEKDLIREIHKSIWSAP